MTADAAAFVKCFWHGSAEAGRGGVAELFGLALPPTTTQAGDGLQLAIAAPHPADADALRLILLRTIEPAYAQLLGLYWVDTAVQPGQLWDYALLADRQAAFAGSVKAALAWLNSEPRPAMDVDVAWLLGMERKAADPLPAAPEGVRAYALPIPTRPVDGGSAATVDTPAMTVGLRWVAPKVPNVIGLDVTDLSKAVILPFTMVDRIGRRVQVDASELAKVPQAWKSGANPAAQHIRWAIGDLVKCFDVAVPLTGSGLLPVPSVTEGKTYLQVLVTTADDRALRDWKITSRSLSHQDGAASRTFGPRAGDPRSKQTGPRND
ncbi:MAG: hypothetical protein FJ100_14895 [Deltaproteobacteria bacterium]|nr:hypothetical protein [Deltaproteobacteria bacterium]